MEKCLRLHLNTEEIGSCERFTLDQCIWLDGVSTHGAVAHFSSKSPVGFVKFLLIGHVSSVYIRNSGLSHHVLLLTRSVVFCPLLRQSAGFSLVSTCLHWSGLVLLCISPILFDTNGWNSRPLPRVHHNTFALSDQNVD